MTDANSSLRRYDMRTRRTRRHVAVGLAVILGQLLVPVAAPSVAYAEESTLPLCRSTDGTGATEDTNAASNGFYLSAASRASDTLSGLRIEPVFAKRLYTDLSRGFDATYIAYRITNSTGSDISDVWVSLTGFGGGQVQLVNTADAAQQIPRLANNASITRYFLVRSTGTTESDVVHDVRLHQGIPPSGAQLAGCRTAIKGVQRSIAANPNRVTAISVNGTPTLGQTITVVVDGAFGNVGQGSGPDLSIMAMTPASSSLWPTRALRLEAASIRIKNIAQNALSACATIGGNTSASSGNVRVADFSDTLVIRRLGDCVTTTKQIYTASYTFRVIGRASVDPVIRPIASISSGTQIKYTGSFPSTEVSIAVSDVPVPVTVKKEFVAGSATTDGATAAHVRVQYRLIATSTAGEVTLDAFVDRPPTGAKFISATITDKDRTAVDVAKAEIVESGVTRWRFRGPFVAVTGTPGTPATLTYIVDLPLPGSGVEATYDNFGFATIGTTVVGDTATITGVRVTATDDGTVTTVAIDEALPKEPQTIVFTPPAAVGSGTSTTLGGYSDSGLPLSYVVAEGSAGVCSVSQFDGVWTLVALAEGTCTVTATQGGNDTFAAATPVDRDILVLRGQVITATHDTTFGANTSRPVSVVADSKLAVGLTSINTEVCTVTVQTVYDAISGVTIYNAVKGAVAGACLLVATQPGGEREAVTFGPAPDLEILIGSGTAQTITFANPAGDDTNATPSVAGDDTPDAVATSSANASLTGTAQLPVEFASLTPAVCGITSAGVDSDGAPLSGMNTTTGVTTRRIELRAAGTCTIRATQDGTNDAGAQSAFAPAAAVTRTFTVRSTGTTPQSVVLDALIGRTYGDPDVTVTATSKTPDGDGTATGLRVTFRATTNACAVSSSTLVGDVSTASIAILRAGACTIETDQAGDLVHASATVVTGSFTIAPKGLTVSGLAVTDRLYDATDGVAVTGTPALVGVVPGDGPSAIGVTGAVTATVAGGGDVGAGLDATVSGLTLTGTRIADYTLTQPTLTVTISQRPITLTADDATVGLDAAFACTASVSSGALQGADALGTVTCDPTNSGASAGTQTISITANPIGRGGVDVLPNYAVTRATGTLTVTSLTVPVLTAPAIDAIYGVDISTVLGTLNDGGVTALDGTTEVAGTVSHSLSGTLLSDANGVLDAGTYSLSVTFTPSEANSGTVAQASTTRAVTVRKRDLTITGLSATGRQYDGTSIVAVTGTASLIALPDGVGDGVFSADADASRLSTAGGSGSGSVTGPSAGPDLTVTLTGITLTGTQASNYLLTLPTLSVTITQRPLTITPSDAVKLANAVEPTYAVAYDGFVAGEDEQDLTGSVSVTRLAGETAGQYTLNAIGGANANYQITRNSATLFVVALTIGVDEADRQVDCLCGGLRPGSAATVTIFSTPAVIAEVTVADDGTCPGLSGAIPESIPPGDHTLRLDGVAPDAGSTPVTIALPVLLGNEVVTGSGGRTGGGSGGGGPAPTAGPDPAPTNGAVGNGSSPSPVVRRFPPAPSASPGVDAPTVVRPFPSPGAGPTPGPAQPAPAPALSDTLDLGDRNGTVSLPPTATFREVLAVTRTAATRQLSDLAREPLGGFGAGTGLRVEVIGSRTMARFVLSTTERVDAVVLSEALRRSAPTQAAEFASISAVTPVARPQLPSDWSTEVRATADDVFAAARLPAPRLLTDLDIPADATWLRIEMTGATYLPGSHVHLTVTSEPVVLASVVVGRDGRVAITGDLPIDILSAGEHRIRLVGIRAFNGISTDAAGEITIPDEVLREIERFDLGTDATVRIVGDNGAGGTHTAIRIIPLDPTPPWWTLWIVAIAWMIVVVLRRRGRLEGRRGRIIGTVTVLVSGVPAVILGWIATTTEVAWWGVGLAVLAALVASVIVPRPQDRSDAEVEVGSIAG